MTSSDPSRAIPTSRSFRVSADFFQQRFIKYPKVAECHSYAELLYLALLEFDPHITSFTPQPKKLKINGRRYIPDCFYVRNGERCYVELKPRGELDSSLQLPIQEYAKRRQCKFEVVANETVLEHETKAKNNLHMLRVLLSSTEEETDSVEDELLSLLFTNRSMEIADIIDRDDRIGNREKEIALYRLVHKGLVLIDTQDEMIGYRTRASYVSRYQTSDQAMFYGVH